MFCSKCGQGNDDSTKFCTSCGTALAQANASAPAAKGAITDTALFTFMAPFLSHIDSGCVFRQPFSWLYKVIAVLNIIFPLYVLYTAIDNQIFQAPAKYLFTFFFMWLVIAFAGWLSFQIWWLRSERAAATSEMGDEFVATPAFSHFIQTLGEWAGTWIAVVGTIFALLATLLLGGEGAGMADMLGRGILKSGVMAIFTMPLYGFLIIVFSRFLAEQWKAIVSIANNTKK